MIILSRASRKQQLLCVSTEQVASGLFGFLGYREEEKVTSQIITWKGFDVPAAIHLVS